MESAGGLRQPHSDATRAASEPAGSNTPGGRAGWVSGTQERRRTRHPNALARFAAPGRSHHDVETPRSYCALTPGVQPKIWVTISPVGEGGPLPALSPAGAGRVRGL